MGKTVFEIIWMILQSFGNVDEIGWLSLYQLGWWVGADAGCEMFSRKFQARDRSSYHTPFLRNSHQRESFKGQRCADVELNFDRNETNGATSSNAPTHPILHSQELFLLQA